MKKIKLFGILILVALVAVGAWYFFLRKKENPVALDTEQPTYGYIARSVTATGTVEPVDTVNVGSQVSGTIKAVYADFNSKVKKGQLIAEIDKSLLMAQVNQYRANLEVAQSQQVYQKSTYDRQNTLFQTGAISRADYENATYLYNTSKANVLSVQAQLDAAEKSLSYTNIYSPVDGVVMVRNVSLGQTVASSFNTPTLFILAKDISKMQVQAAVDEADIGNVRESQRATFTVDAFPDNQFSGVVEEIRLQPTVSANVVTYSTIIKTPNDDLKLKPGMTANIIIYTMEEDSALLISARALKFKPDPSLAKQFKIGPSMVDSAAASSGKRRSQHGGSGRDSIKRKTNDLTAAVVPKRAYVWLLKGDSLVQKRILVGLNDDAHVQVLRGLSQDDEVVDGLQATNTKVAASAGGTKSPFMPQRAGGNARRPQSAR